MSRVTSVHVAERAGVSRSAVSRVFTPGASVSQTTVDKVRKAADELGYRPNVLARAMLTGRSRIIGLVVAYLDNHFYPTVLEQLSSALEREGYHVLVFMAAPTGPEVADVVEEILDYQVDGLILASVKLSSDLVARCRTLNVPVVVFNRRPEDASAVAIVSDNADGGRLAARHLLDCGATRIAHIAGDTAASTQVDRETGFLNELARQGVPLFARGVGGFDPDQAKVVAREMFRRAERPDAVFVANDYMAFMVLDVLRHELGLRVPQDVKVVGFDDVPTAAWPAYDLTTLRQDGARMVDQTVATLMSGITGEEMSGVAPLPVQLVVRGSSVGAE